MNFIMNAWYSVGWSKDVTRSLTHRRVMGEDMVLFRKENGQVAAIGDICPHRFAPLHQGKLIGDRVQCPYHGLEFASTGKCVKNPVGNKQIPERAAVKAHVVEERQSVVWLWMGDPALADPARIPDYHVLDSPDWVAGSGGYIHCDANYMLMVDNLLDLSHVAFLHPDFGNESMAGGELTVERDGPTVSTGFWMPDTEVPAYLQDRFDPSGRIDQWLDMAWRAPSSLLINYGATRHGAPRDEGFTGWGIHLLTPETATSCHYYFNIVRPAGPGAEEAVARDHASQHKAFSLEDKPMAEACQRAMGSRAFREMNPVVLSSDAAAMRVRQIVDTLLREQVKADA